MDSESKQALQVWLIAVLLLFILILLIAAIYILRTEGGKCARNPKSYLINRWEKSNNSSILCSCYALSEFGGTTQTMEFGSEGLTMKEIIKKMNKDEGFIDFNFSS